MNPIFARNLMAVMVATLSGIAGFTVFSPRPASEPANTPRAAVARESDQISAPAPPAYSPSPILADTTLPKPSNGKGKKMPLNPPAEKKMAVIIPRAKKGNETFATGPTLDSLRDQLRDIKKIIGPEPNMQAFAVTEIISPEKVGNFGIKIPEVARTTYPRYEEALRTYATRELRLLAFVEFPFGPSLASECEHVIKAYIGPEPNMNAFAVVQTISPEMVGRNQARIPEVTRTEYPGYETAVQFYSVRKKALLAKLNDSLFLTARQNAVWIPGFFTKFETFVPGHYRSYPDGETK
jgi:hypothetical protein